MYLSKGPLLQSIASKYIKVDKVGYLVAYSGRSVPLRLGLVIRFAHPASSSERYARFLLVPSHNFSILVLSITLMVPFIYDISGG